MTAALDDFEGFGGSLAPVGDLDGDGVVDMVVGASFDDDGGTDRGAVYVLFLNADGTVKAEQKISDTTGGLTTALDDQDFFGRVTALGDIDGDGVTDLAVGAHRDDDGASSAGAVYVLFLNTDGTVKAEQKISNAAGGLTTPLLASNQFGISAAGLGDVDGDGINDLLVGANGDTEGGSSRGAAFVLFLNADGTVKAEQKISDTTGGLAATLDDSDGFGVHTGALGDLDGDGIPDAVVAAYNDDDGGTNRGAVYVLFLNADGTVKAEQKISDTVGGLTATLEDWDYFGSGAIALGDVYGNGGTVLAVGASGDDDGGTTGGRSTCSSSAAMDWSSASRRSAPPREGWSGHWPMVTPSAPLPPSATSTATGPSVWRSEPTATAAAELARRGLRPRSVPAELRHHGCRLRWPARLRGGRQHRRRQRSVDQPGTGHRRGHHTELPGR